MRQNKELEEQLAQHQGTRIHLEKLQNEKRDMARRIKELRAEEKLITDQLEMKKAEHAELQEQIKPSPIRARYEADVARLRKEVSAHTAARTHAEREAAVHSKRLLRVRAVLTTFLKAEGLKPQQPLPPANDELAARLADHVLALAEKVRTLERTIGGREEKAKELQASSAQAAEELKRLVARRGKEQRKITAAAGLLTEGGASEAETVDRIGDAATETTAATAIADTTAKRVPRPRPPKVPKGKKNAKVKPKPADSASTLSAPEWVDSSDGVASGCASGAAEGAEGGAMPVAAATPPSDPSAEEPEEPATE